MDGPGDLREGITIVKSFFYNDTIRQSQMLLIAFRIIHDTSLSAQAGNQQLI